MAAYENDLISVAEAARLAGRSKEVIRRWVREGWVDLAFKVPGRNGPWLLDRSEFELVLPDLLERMATRRGGRGNKALDAQGNERA